MSFPSFERAVAGAVLVLAWLLGAGCSDSTGPKTGAIRVTVTTTGAELDRNGYSLALDGGAGQAIPVNDTITLAGLSAGSHDVLLSGLPTNCAVAAANPRAVDVVSGATAYVAFAVTCVAGPGRILFVSERSGTIQIFVMNADGSAQVQLTSDSLGALDPNWSPDGTTFVYSSIRGITDPLFLRGYYAIVVKNADGSGGRTLVNLDDTFEPAPAWSPDGSKIAFFYDQSNSGGQIFLINADGTGMRQFTTSGANIGVAWSPDGSKIALSAYGGSGYDIFVKDVNGSGLAQLTTTAGATDRAPAWSHDGGRIAFVSDRDGNEEIYVMNADGSGQTRLTTDPGVDYAPTWSPDGSKIAFHSDSSGTLQVYVMNADGSGLTQLTNDPTGAGYPSWGR
jgi:Tol biopolymer transport system component